MAKNKKTVALSKKETVEKFYSSKGIQKTSFLGNIIFFTNALEYVGLWLKNNQRKIIIKVTYS